MNTGLESGEVDRLILGDWSVTAERMMCRSHNR
jgi:hypothetical protein